MKQHPNLQLWLEGNTDKSKNAITFPLPAGSSIVQGVIGKALNHSANCHITSNGGSVGNIGGGHECTVCFWVRRSDSNNNKYAFEISTATSNYSAIYAYFQPSLTINFGESARNSANQLGGIVGSLTTSQWYHAAATYSNGSIKIYRDGELIESGTGWNGVIGSAGYVKLLGYSDINYAGMNGDLDDLQIYNVALPVSDIKRIMNGKSPLMRS